MGLQKFEERLERLMEGTLARPFRSSLQPVEISRKLTREMDLQRRVGARGLLAPNRYTVTLSVEDAERFSAYADALIRELITAAHEHARAEGYSFVGPVTIEIFQSSKLKNGQCSITAAVSQGGAPAFLVLADGRRTPIADRAVVIGRLPGCEVVLQDTNVSRQHASVRRNDDRYFLADLGSTNGTRLNGKPVTEAELQNGDLITVGSTTLTFETY